MMTFKFVTFIYHPLNAAYQHYFRYISFLNNLKANEERTDPPVFKVLIVRKHIFVSQMKNFSTRNENQ